MSSMTSKTLFLSVSETTTKFTQIENKSKIQQNFSSKITCSTRHRKGKRAFVEENKNKLVNISV